MDKLRQRIETYFAKELTVGRTAQGLEPFNYSQIAGFISKNNTKINTIVNDIIAEDLNDLNDDKIRDWVYTINTDVNSNLENMSIIKCYDLKFTFEYVISEYESKNNLGFTFHNCIILKPGFTKYTKGYTPGTRVNSIDMDTIIKKETFTD